MRVISSAIFAFVLSEMLPSSANIVYSGIRVTSDVLSV
jgi:hypothetical protein